MERVYVMKIEKTAVHSLKSLVGLFVPCYLIKFLWSDLLQWSKVTWIMVCQSNWWIRDVSGFISSFVARDLRYLGSLILITGSPQRDTPKVPKRPTHQTTIMLACIWVHMTQIWSRNQTRSLRWFVISKLIRNRPRPLNTTVFSLWKLQMFSIHNTPEKIEKTQQ